MLTYSRLCSGRRNLYVLKKTIQIGLKLAKIRGVAKKIKRILVQYIQQFVKGDVPTSVSALSFSTLLAIVPFIAVVLGTLKFTGILDNLYPRLKIFLLTSIAGPAGEQGAKAIQNIIEHLSPTKLGVLGLIGLLFTSLLLLLDIERSVHRVWSERNTRPLYQRFFIYWLLLLFAPGIYGVLFAISSIKSLAGFTGHLPVELNLFVFFTVLLFLLNKFTPALKVKAKAALAGAVFSTVLLITLIRSFAILTSTFLNYSKFYGGLAAFPTFLIWIFLTWYCVLAGVALTASLHEDRNNGGNKSSKSGDLHSSSES